jgi:mercuric reductase
MNTIKVDAAVSKLNRILPLRENQLSLSRDVVDMHRAILESYLDLGRSLTRVELEALADNAAEGIESLAGKDMVVIDPDGELTGAYPFTMENRMHTVEINGRTVHCMCALDALSVAPMFEMAATVKSACNITGEPVVVVMESDKVTNRADVQDLFFAISWNATDNVCCASSLCTEMIFLKGKQVADQWCGEDAESRECFTLDEAIEFAARFFRPLLQALPD